MSEFTIKPSERLLTAEVGVLGSMLIDEKAVGPMLMAVSESDFYTPEYRNIFRMVKALYSQGDPIDLLIVNERLGGGYSQLLIEICEGTPTAANADLYAEELKKASRMHHLRQIGEALALAKDDEECRELLDKGNALFIEGAGIVQISMKDAFLEFFKRHDQTVPKNHLKWGFSGLNEELHVGKGDMVIIGGHPSAGKTALSLQFAFTMAQTKKVGFYSYETDKDKLHDRMVACQAHISYRKLMTDTLTVDDYRQVKSMRGLLTAPDMVLIEASGMSVSSIAAHAMANHFDIVVIDYIQKIPARRSGRYLSDTEAVSQVSHELQTFGRRTGKTIIALSQLSRAEKNKAGQQVAPTMSDLRQSGQLEQDADVIMLLWKEFPDAAVSRRYLKIAKNKNGESGLNMLLDFDGLHQTFSKSAGQPLPTPARKPENPVQQSMFHPEPNWDPCPFDKEHPPQETETKS